MSASGKPVMVVADFDDTLITVDSLCAMMKKRHWYLDPAMIRAGAGIVFAKASGGNELRARSRFKWLMLRRYHALPDEEKRDWITYVRQRFTTGVLGQIRDLAPEKVIIASASDADLIRRVLDGVLSADDIIASVFTEDESSFQTCYGQWKADRFAERHPERTGYHVVVFTDSESDRPLMRLADEVRLIRR